LSRELEFASSTNFAFDPDSTTHQLGQSGRDSKAQPGSTEAARSGRVGLRELLENR
jgi:hypothetical protein